MNCPAHAHLLLDFFEDRTAICERKKWTVPGRWSCKVQGSWDLVGSAKGGFFVELSLPRRVRDEYGTQRTRKRPVSAKKD